MMVYALISIACEEGITSDVREYGVRMDWAKISIVPVRCRCNEVRWLLCTCHVHKFCMHIHAST
jgi:hypothetical protein